VLSDELLTRLKAVQERDGIPVSVRGTADALADQLHRAVHAWLKEKPHLADEAGAASSSDEWRHRWQYEDGLSPREAAMLCCGWNYKSRVIPDQEQYNDALERIRRALEAGTLKPIDSTILPMPAEKFYDDRPLVAADVLATWARSRGFDKFPQPEEAARQDDAAAEAKALDREGLVRWRWKIIKAFEKKHEVNTHADFCKLPALGGEIPSPDALGALVRDETRKHSRHALSRLLKVLGITPERWNNPE
jgi:hypothetical protein